MPIEGEVVERWGGVGYAVAAAAATLPPGWHVRLVARVGRDLAAEAEAMLSEIPRCDLRLTIVDEPNNRVELLYRNAQERTEILTGGVSGWRAEELVRSLEGCAAVLVNFISGHELTLADACILRARMDVPIYADLHSLFLGTEPDGTRTSRPLDEWRAWLSCFDYVQMNETEFAQLRASPDGPPDLESVLDAGPAAVSVTVGSRGAMVGARHEGRRRVRDVTLQHPRVGDPTGCGDIWGAVMFGRLLAGESEWSAAETANRVAAASLDHQGVEGLADRLEDISVNDAAGGYLETLNEGEH